LPSILRPRQTAYLRLGKYAEAIDDSTKAIRLDPDDAQAYHLRGVTCEELRKHKLAEKDKARERELGSPVADLTH